MKHRTSTRAIQEIVTRLTRLERAVFKLGPESGTEKGRKDVGGEGLPAHILKLREQNFFKDPKTAGEVRERLKPRYLCEHDRVAMALLRLQRQRQLRKASKAVGKKKQLAYVW